MIIGCELMVKLCLTDEFGHQILEWDKTVVPMKEPGNLTGQNE